MSTNIAVLYKSKYGTTRTYAKWIADKLHGDLYSIDNVTIQNLNNYEFIVFAGALYAGKLSSAKRIKQFFANSKLKLKTLAADIYETHKTEYVIIDGKKIRERDLPNCVGRPNDYKNLVWKKVKFYPEDEAVMAKMKTAREQIEYKKKLLKSGKYIE